MFAEYCKFLNLQFHFVYCKLLVVIKRNLFGDFKSIKINIREHIRYYSKTIYMNTERTEDEMHLRECIVR